MSYMLTHSNSNKLVKYAVFDILAISFIYFVPTISHLLALPIYLIEPMRIMLILAMAHTRKENAYIIALSLPIFSFAISGHPLMPKMLLICSELLLNVWLFFFLSKYMKNVFIVSFISVAASKLFYYIAKYVLISSLVLNTQLISTPLILQFIVAIALSTYLFFIAKESSYL